VDADNAAIVAVGFTGNFAIADLFVVVAAVFVLLFAGVRGRVLACRPRALLVCMVAGTKRRLVIEIDTVAPPSSSSPSIG